jgi:hypothetical protein
VPRTAASVSTRVVSWNEAAEMNDSVASEALVMPSSTGSYSVAGLPVPRDRAVVLLEHARAIDLLAAQEAGIAGRRDLDLAQHLANDHLDVLVVDLHALQAVDVLDFLDQVAASGSTPCRRRMSCGFGSPSTTVSPFSTCSPSNTMSVAPLRDQLLVLLAVLRR